VSLLRSSPLKSDLSFEVQGPDHDRFLGDLFLNPDAGWHLAPGPSELHLIGATTVYLLFGFAPAIVGFGLGLLLQA
jgi:hypothetical protein